MVKGSVPGNNGAEIVLKPSVNKKNKNGDQISAMELKVLDKKGAITESRKVLEAVFSKNYSGWLVHQLVESYRANGRGGNRAQKIEVV